MSNNNFFSLIMSMNDSVWRRHANPISVWSRILTGLPLLLTAIWSLHWIGIWAIALIILAVLWLWLNPRLFSAPRNTNNWASKVTLGERVWLNRKQVAIAAHHSTCAIFLSLTAGLGFVTAVTGAIFALPFPMWLGASISWLGKMWFCDRMVWLFEDMKNHNEEYSSWLTRD